MPARAAAARAEEDRPAHGERDRQRPARTTSMALTRAPARRFRSSGRCPSWRASRVQGIARSQTSERSSERSRPGLEVRGLDLGTQGDAPAGAAQPRPELDVLDARPAVARPRSRRRPGTPRAGSRRSRPRRCRASRPPGLVHVVVEEVLVLGDRARRAPAAHRRSRTGRRCAESPSKDGHHPRQGVGMDAHVGVHEHQVAAAGAGRATVARRARARTALGRRRTCAPSISATAALMSVGGVVDDDDLVVAEGGVAQGLEADAQALRDRCAPGPRPTARADDPRRSCASLL